MELRKESSEGEEAKRILDSTVFKDAMQTLSDGYMSEWVNSEATDQERRETVYMKLRILADFVNELQTVLQTGQMADEQIRQEEKPKSTVN